MATLYCKHRQGFGIWNRCCDAELIVSSLSVSIKLKVNRSSVLAACSRYGESIGATGPIQAKNGDSYEVIVCCAT